MASHASDRATSVGSGTLLMLAALAAFAPFAIDTALPALPDAMERFGAGTSSFRLVTTATFIGLGIGQAVGGPLSDRVGRRLPAIGAAWAFAASALACSLAQSLLWLQVTSLMAGVSASVGIVASRAAIRDLAHGDQAAHLLARVWAVGGLVPVLAPLLGAGVFAVGGWRAIYVCLAAYGVVLAVTLTLRFRETQPFELRHAGTHADTWRLGLALLRDRRFLSYTGVLSGGMVCFISYVSAAPFIFQRLYGWSPIQFSFLYALNGLCSVIVTRWTTRHVVRIGAHRLLVRGLWLTSGAGAIVLLGGLLDSPWVIALGFLGLLCAWALSMNNIIALAMSSQSVASGTASAALGVASYVAGGLVSSLVGAAGGVGGATTGLIMLGGMAVAGAFLAFVHTHDVSEELMA